MENSYCERLNKIVDRENIAEQNGFIKELKNSDGETIKAIPVTREEWKKTHRDYKDTYKGIKHMLRLEDGITVSRAVYITD